MSIDRTESAAATPTAPTSTTPNPTAPTPTRPGPIPAARVAGGGAGSPVARGARPSGAFVAARWLLRILITVTAVLIALQPVSIGQYLQGRYTMLAMHANVATGAIVASFVAT